MNKLLSLFLILCICSLIEGRKHKLEISNDSRRYIALSTFGFYKGGMLYVKLENFRANPANKDNVYGFSIDRTQNDAMNPYLDTHADRCLLQGSFPTEQHFSAAIYFTMDLNKNIMSVNCSRQWQQPVHIYKNISDVPAVSNADGSEQAMDIFANNNIFRAKVRRDVEAKPDLCRKLILPITNQTKDDGQVYYNTSFVIFVASDSEEGLYNLYFHSCPNYATLHHTYHFTMRIIEQNIGGYLSAGEMPLPALYCTMAFLFLLSGSFWLFLLRQSHHPKYKIHYLMACLVFLKSISLAFHGVNYHFIETLGVHLATWAILFYVAHLLKGALLFITLILVGSGWTFIKYVLNKRDKRLFMAIIPLQFLANVAEIILQESEEGSIEHNAWRDVLILVDLLCCGCILFPVVWSIRHLQEASQTDGKAVINLRKLKLFRHFYVMIVCYIYFTRIIVYLLKITVPFQYGWLDEMCAEMATYVFFVLTGYKFRPASHNPYFALPLDDDEEDLVLTESGATEGLSRVTSRSNKHSKQIPTLTEVTEEESDSLLTQKESSHEYD